MSSSCQLSFTAASSQPRQGARQLLDSSSARDRYLQPGWAPVFSGSRPVQDSPGTGQPVLPPSIKALDGLFSGPGFAVQEVKWLSL